MERTGKFLLRFGFLLLVIITIIFLWRKSIFDFSKQINFEKLNQYGNVVGGVLGPLWALSGILLYYSALKQQQNLLSEQQNQIELQTDILKKQQEHIKSQTTILRDQQFENSLFNLSNQWLQTTSYLTYKYDHKNSTRIIGKDCFSKYFKDFKSEYKKITDDLTEENKISKAYNIFYSKTNGCLDHYFITFYELLRHINSRCNGTHNEKISYAGIVRSQITNDELKLLFYNSFSPNHGKYKTLGLMQKYDIIKRMDCSGLLSNNHIDLYKNLISIE